MKVSRQIYDELLAHAREDAPNECCGLIGGNDGVAKTVYPRAQRRGQPAPIQPRSPGPVPDHDPDGREGGGARGHLPLPHGEPGLPSQTDINLAAYPDALYLIVSLAEGEEPLRGYRIEDGKVDEVELQVE